MQCNCRFTDNYYNNLKNLSFDYELKGISFQNVLTLHKLMTQKLLNAAQFFVFFSSSRFGVTLEAVFLRFCAD